MEGFWGKRRWRWTELFVGIFLPLCASHIIIQPPPSSSTVVACHHHRCPWAITSQLLLFIVCPPTRTGIALLQRGRTIGKCCCGCLVRLSLVLRTRRPALLFRSLFPFPRSRNFAHFSTSSALPRHHSCPFTSSSSSVAIEANQPPLQHSCNSLPFVLLSGNASTYIC